MRRLMLVAATLLTRPLAAQTGLTIYNDGRVLVRRTLPLALGSGVSNHRLSLGLLDPASLFALDSGVVVVGSAYDESVDEVNTMRRAVGLTLKFLNGREKNGIADTVTATVLGVNPERFRLAGGQIVFQRPGLPLYPAELVLADPTLAAGDPLGTGAALAPARVLYQRRLVERQLLRRPRSRHRTDQRPGVDPLRDASCGRCRRAAAGRVGGSGGKEFQRT